MSDDDRFGGISGAPAGGTAGNQDYGFFASGPVSAPSQFGTPSPPRAPVAPPAPMYAPPAPPVPGTALPAPVPNQFGPPPQAPIGAPMYAPQPYQPAPRRGLPVWAIVAICVPSALVVLGILAAIAIPVFLSQRSTPVLPAQLGGLATTTDPQLKTLVATVEDELARRNEVVKSKAAGYGNLQSGYLLSALGARVNPDREFQDLGATTPPVHIGDAQCAINTAQHVSMCVHTGVRGAVEVVAFGPLDLASLASVTDEAWSAQPFGG